MEGVVLELLDFGWSIFPPSHFMHVFFFSHLILSRSTKMKKCQILFEIHLYPIPIATFYSHADMSPESVAYLKAPNLLHDPVDCSDKGSLDCHLTCSQHFCRVDDSRRRKRRCHSTSTLFSKCRR